MQEHTVTVATHTYPLPEPFFVLATQNPIEQEGTYPLPEAQLDRFLFKINVGFPSPDELTEILTRTTGKEVAAATTAVSGPTILAMQQLARQIPIPSNVTGYVSRLVVATHPGGSPSATGQQLRALRGQPARRAGVGAGGQDYGAVGRPSQREL
jgi:MoxR-like ATPase